MKKTTYLAQRNSTGNIKIMTINLDGDTVYQTWGILNGKMQSTPPTVYDFINKGKANELNPPAAAEAGFNKIIKTKTDEGYLVVESLDEIPEEELDKDVMDLDNIPKQFCCSKPTSKISEKALDKLNNSDHGDFFIKYNGSCHYILIISTGDVKLYTRRMDDHTVKYPAIVAGVKELNLPPKTLLITEFVIDPELKIPHMEAFRIMQTISKANVSAGKPKKDLSKNNARQDVANGGHRVRACVFGILYYGDEQVWHLPMIDIYETLHKDIPKLITGHELFLPEALAFSSARRAIDFAKKNKHIYEGLVVWDNTKAMEVTFNGKPKRRAAWKVKPTAEMDVIAFGYNLGTKGKLQGKIGSLKIGKYKADGSIFDMGDCGSGLKPNSGDNEIENWTFPQVIEVEYDQIFPTGKLQFPRFSKKHEDKLPEDVEIMEVA